MYDCKYPHLLEEHKLEDPSWMKKTLDIHTMLVNGCDIAGLQKVVLRAIEAAAVTTITATRHEWLWITHRKFFHYTG